MIAVTPHASGSILPIWVKPGARSNSLDDVHDGALVVSVTAAPEGGKANEAIVDVLAKNLNLRRTQFQLLSGATARKKRFLITGIRREDLIARIEAALTPTIYDPADPEL
jgi:uncharacterized protein YggU (UPF0235/DUF167 family)